MDTPLTSAMRLLSGDLRNALAATRVIPHNLTAGEVREDIFADALRPYLPGRYEISSGVVVNAAGAFSTQQDLVITDTIETAPVFASGRIGIHPIESVRACIEIKSEPSTTQVQGAVQGLATVRALAPDEPRTFTAAGPEGFGMGETSNKCFTGIVAYGAPGNPETLAAAFHEESLTLPPLNRCDALLVVDHLVCLWIDGHGGIVLPENGVQLGYAALAGDSLLVFYSWLLHRLADFKAVPLEVLDYASQAEPLRGLKWGVIGPA
jgi:hypothetical protein